MSQFIAVGRITKPHGIKGEVCVDFYADSPSILGDTVFLETGKGGRSAYGLKNARFHHSRLLLTLENIPDRNAAELLRNAEIVVPRSRLPKLADGEVYLFDLPGYTVILSENNETLGEIDAVDLSSGQEIWRIITPDGKEVLFPAVPEFVEAIDVEARTAHISPPPGLLDIYL